MSILCTSNRGTTAATTTTTTTTATTRLLGVLLARCSRVNESNNDDKHNNWITRGTENI